MSFKICLRAGGIFNDSVCRAQSTCGFKFGTVQDEKVHVFCHECSEKLNVCKKFVRRI